MTQKRVKEGIVAGQNQASPNSFLYNLVFPSVNLLAIITVALAFSRAVGQSQILFQPPANDDFSKAIPLTGYSLSVTSLNTWATGEPGEPAHEGHPANRSTWWQWVAPGNGLTQVKCMFTPLPQHPPGVIVGPAWFDPIYVGIYTGNALTNLAPVDLLPESMTNSTGGASFQPKTYIFRVTAGESYYFAADTVSGYTFSLNLSFGNLLLVQPTILTNLTPNQPIILEFAPVDTNFAIASLEAFAGTNQLAVLTNDPPQYVYMAEKEGTVPVWALGTNATGQTLLALTNYLTFKPPNDDFADAAAISNDFPDSFLTDIMLATSEPNESNLVAGVTFRHTVWWKWTPLYIVPTEFRLTSLGSQLVIFRGTSLTNLELMGILRTTMFSWDNNTTVTFTPEAGDTYYVLGDGFQSFLTIGDGSPTLSWSLVPHTLELSPGGSQQGYTDVPFELEASWIESNRPSSSVDFIIGQMPGPINFGQPVEIGPVGSSSSAPYRAGWTPTECGTYYIWARCTNSFGALRESDKTAFMIRFSNDNFSGATVIPNKATSASYSFSTVGATIENGERGHRTYPPIATRWWKWTPSYSDIVRFKASRELQAVPLDVYVGGSLPNLQLIATNFKRIYRLGISGAVTVPVHARQTYFIRVDDFYPESHKPGIPPSNITLTLESATNGPRAEILLSLLKNSRSGPVPFSWIMMPDGSPVKGTNFLAQLYVGTNVASLRAVGPAQPFRIPIWDYPSPLYSGGVPWPVPVILPDVKAYSPVVAQIRVWDSNAGTSFETAESAGGLTGKSNPVRLIAGSEDAGPARLTGINSFKLSARSWP